MGIAAPLMRLDDAVSPQRGPGHVQIGVVSGPGCKTFANVAILRLDQRMLEVKPAPVVVPPEPAVPVSVKRPPMEAIFEEIPIEVKAEELEGNVSGTSVITGG